MTTITTNLIRLAFLGTLLALALGINYVMAWTGPTQQAPNGNVEAPINASLTLQDKLGPLSVGTFSASNTRAMIVYGALATKGWVAVGTNNIAAATQPPAALLHLRGRAGIDGIRFPDGTNQTTAYEPPATPAPTGALTAVRSYTSSGTWTKPAGLSYVVVEVWGGGASGQSYGGVNGTAGGTSIFGSVSATGGQLSTDNTFGGQPGSGIGGDVNLTGGRGATAAAYDGNISAAGGNGGNAPRGGSGGAGGWSNNFGAFAGAVPGGGGGGAGDHHAANSPAAGSAGGYAYKRFNASDLGATVPVTVGAGGVAAAGSPSGGNGASGMVIVYEYQ